MVLSLAWAAGFAAEALLWYLVLRYNLHMFQLNSYMAGEELSWLAKNWMRQDVLFAHVLTGCVAALSASPFALIPHALLTGFCIYYFNFLRGYLTKKRLVMTQRVQRMIASNALVCVALSLCLAVFAGVSVVYVGLCVLVALQMFLILLVNALNQPMERAINQHFINDAARLLKENPQLKVIGITGSFGKTSVKYYLHALLKDHFNTLITPGNFNTTLGVTRTVRDSLRPTHELFICEMGARYVGEIKEICDLVHPQMGVLTSIGPVHLETFGGIENVCKTKFELIDALPKNGVAFLNFDNDYVRTTEEARQDPMRVVPYGADAHTGGYYACDLELSERGTSFTLVTPNGERERYQMRLVGQHNVVNVVGALSVAHQLGVSLAALRSSVRKIQPVEHRMQMREQAGLTIIDDAYNSNPVGSKAAVETLAMFDGLRILITPGMVELGEEQERYNYEFGTYAARCCDYVAVVGSENRDAIMRGVLDGGVDESHLRSFTKFEDAMSFAANLRDDRHKFVLLENDLPDIY